MTLSEAGGRGAEGAGWKPRLEQPRGAGEVGVGAAGRGALGDGEAVFPLVLIGLCDSNGRPDSPSGSMLARGSRRAPHLRYSGDARQLLWRNRRFWMVLGLEGPGKTKPGLAGKTQGPRGDSGLWLGEAARERPGFQIRPCRATFATGSPEKEVSVKPT